MYSKTFSEIAIIGGVVKCVKKPSYPGNISDHVEVISIIQDAISHINSPIPSLPKKLAHLSGAQLPNGNLVICGGRKRFDDNYSASITEDIQYSDEYLHCQVGSNQWTKVGNMKHNRAFHSSVLLDGCLITTGGCSNPSTLSLDYERLSNLEIFSRHRDVLEMKEMPVALSDHTATMFGKNRILVCGGGAKTRFGIDVSELKHAAEMKFK